MATYTSTTYPNYSTTTLRKYALKNDMVYSPTSDAFMKANEDGTLTQVNVDLEDLSAFGDARQGRIDDVKTQIGNVAGDMFGAASNYLEGKKEGGDKSKVTKGLNTAYSAISDVAMAVFPMAGAIMKAGEFATKALDAMGVGTDQMTTKDAVLDSSFFKLTPVGLANAIGAKKAKDFSTDQDIAERIGASYGGTEKNFGEMENYAGKKYGLFSNKERKKVNRNIDKLNLMQSKMGRIADEAEDEREYVENMGQQYALNYQNQLNGGFNKYSLNRYQYGGYIVKNYEEKAEPEVFFYLEDLGKMYDEYIPTIKNFIPQIITAKDGGMIANFVPEIIYPSYDTRGVSYLAKGGKVIEQLDAMDIEENIQQNLIPEGSMHRELNHMDGVDGITKKGIPVLDENNEQQAEIESNEIIFRYEVSKVIEELCKMYYSIMSSPEEKESACLEVGKLLTKEIMLNTDDRTGLIKTLKKGGKTPAKDGDKKNRKREDESKERVVIVDTIEKPSYDDFFADIPEGWMANYDYRLAYELLPLEKMQRWKDMVMMNLMHPDEPFDDLNAHLPSILYDIERDVFPFAKFGFDVDENPELWFEFDDYLHGIDRISDEDERRDAIEWRKNYTPVFHGDENRWYYEKSSSINDNGHVKYMLEKVMGDPNNPPRGYKVTGERDI